VLLTFAWVHKNVPTQMSLLPFYPKAFSNRAATAFQSMTLQNDFAVHD
jgi:hypothetical protein